MRVSTPPPLPPTTPSQHTRRHRQTHACVCVCVCVFVRGGGGGEGGGQAESTRCFPQFCDTTPYSGSALRFHARSCKGQPPGLLLAKIERTRSTPAESAPFVHTRRSTAHARSRVEHSRVQNWWFAWVGGRAPADARAHAYARVLAGTGRRVPAVRTRRQVTSASRPPPTHAQTCMPKAA